MKSLKIVSRFAMAITFAMVISCTGGNKNEKTAEPVQQTVQAAPVEINDEAKALLSYLNEMGDYVNSRSFPSLIKAESVLEELAKNNLIVDLRSAESFAEGHIKGAVNVAFDKVPTFFTNDIKPFEYERIIMVCYSGQTSSYTASLLRLMGYGNVYAMRWGMSAWNEQNAKDWWLKKVASGFEDKLETKENPANTVLTDFPKMNTGKTSGEEILAARFNTLFESGFSDAIIPAEKVFEQPENYYIINYDRRDKYEAGHIPGAIRYKPAGTLGIVAEMQSIPTDKPVVVYCGTGHNSGFVTAYLRLFGYDAKTLAFGNNSFMHNKMLQDKTILSWLPFNEAEIGNYPTEKN